MALSSLTTNISSSATTFTFTTPIKLDRSNYLIWKSQILSSVRANELESLLDGSKICPDQFLSSTQGNSDAMFNASTSSTVTSQENPEFHVWKKQDQMLLSWLLSSISIEILSLVVNSKTSYELWSSLEQQFGSETAAKKVHLKMMLNNLKKGSMTMTEYFSKLKSVTDELAIAGSPVSSLDFITHLISGLGQPYYPVVVYIEANVLKMSINEAYSMLLTHEARLESNQSNSFKEVKQNYAANLAQAGNNQKKVNNQGGWNGNTGNKPGFHNWNGNFTNRGGFNPGRGQNSGRGQWNNNWNNWNGNQGRGNFAGAARNFSGRFPGGYNGFGRGGGRGNIVCQICFKHNHTAADCKDRFNRNFVPNFSVQGNFPDQNQTSRAAFMATSEGVADQGWYLDSGATHHLTNNMENLAEGTPYLGSQLLLVGNGQGLRITSIGNICLLISFGNQLNLSNVLCVPKITKNLISLSKLLSDNHIIIEFVSNLCFIKDKMQGTLLAQGIAEDGLFKLLTQDTPLSDSKALGLKPSSMLSVFSNKENVHSLKELNHQTNVCSNLINSNNENFVSFLASSSQSMQLLHNSQLPDYKFSKVFGCSCFPFLRPYHHHKLDFHTQKCVFIGYSPIHKGYKCLDRTGKVFVARHVTFNELEFPYSELFLKTKSNILSHSATSTPSSVHFFLPQTPVLSHSSNEEPSAAVSSPVLSPASESHSLPHSVHSQSLDQLSRSSNSSPPVISTHPMVTRSKAGIYKPKTYLVVSQDLEPSNVKTALTDPRWYSAMKEEFEALQRNQTWTLVPPESAGKIVGNKWVYRVKYNADGSISRYKARLVAKGYHQTYGVDFFETFSPVIKPCTVRIILSLAVMHHWPIKQLDVNNAFLNGILTEDVYMHQPQGFVDSTYPSFICKLNKALYGLKQAPRAWYDRLKESLVQWGFRVSKSDTSLFIKHAGTNILLILIYVDDILVTGSDSKLIGNVIQQLHSEFALKELGDFHYFLGIEVTPSVHGIHLSQTKYIGDILKRANMLDSKGCVTPMSTSEKLHKDTGAAFENPSLYRSIVGSLQYVLLTRPDLAFTVNKLSQFLSAPTILHWQACKRVLRYLQSTADYGLQFFSSGSLKLTAYSDADWGADPDDRRSVGGYCVFLGSNLISWSSKKQPIVSRSSAESEYRALAMATSEVLWITYLFQELNISFDQIPLLHCDNKSAEALASNPKYHARTKHIELDLHFLREHIAQQQLSVTYVPSSDQLADVLTKPLCFDQFAYLRSKLNVLSRHQA
ncbi:retrovirus-related pol polyprotein from transposon RE1 [Citrus sinensis]|uniref:Retrovirus-related pol polyprotein from transposon RE1 n=1 Tax=Citrus sinensis TaxID=2711 RepID=A0ACB8I6G8_CITSI|nr:retrovirus-related pol polyprotein from transposon RE1 [Citrus sinensis]